MNGTDFAWKTIVVEEAELAKIAGNADGGQALPLESAAKWKDYELCGRARNEGSDGRAIVLAATGRTTWRHVEAHGGASMNDATTGHLWVSEWARVLVWNLGSLSTDCTDGNGDTNEERRANSESDGKNYAVSC
ncbi:hypothetical protein GN958_ATG06591 [Phytophthora infestans]|uniref:Uncharacterized protein n=1 Tax=Phytophthora infestans TaxID=4787 RepID=A0A8S9UU96_PHYIN|nr:hypothetical protein GN958_ATG06591 [Phytophthora infestans]